MQKVKVQRLEFAIYEFISEFELTLDYHSVYKKYIIFDVDTSMPLPYPTNMFDTIGEAGQWFLANLRFIHRALFAKGRKGVINNKILRKMK